MLNIAINTFREIIRNKYLYMILFFALIFIAFSVTLWKLTIWDDSKIIVDFWLSMIEIFWLIWVVFIWSQLLFKEVEWKTIFLILSKPIKRYEFIIWKIMWFSMVIFLIVLFQSIVFLFVLYSYWTSFDNWFLWFFSSFFDHKSIEITPLIIWSLINTFLKLEIALAIVFFLSTFMSNMLTITSSIMIYFLSHNFSILLDLVNKWQNYIAIHLVRILELLFPPFEALNTKDVIWTFSNFSNSFFILNVFYSLLYFWVLILLTIVIFSRKKFES